MIQEANRRAQGLPPLGQPGFSDSPEAAGLPQLRSSEVPEIVLPHERLAALMGVDQDLKKIEEDIKRSQFQLGDPSTWLDTRTDDAKNEARDRYKEAAERYRDLLSDDLSSEAERRAAAEELLRARSDFDRARGVVEQQAASADYLTPLTELVQLGQDAYHDSTEKQRAALVDQLTDLGLPPALVGLAALPGELTDGTVDALAGLVKSPVYVADDIAGMIAHPVDTVSGLVQLGLRAEDASYSGRTLRFLVEAASGKYQSLDEAEGAFLEEMDQRSVFDAQSQLVLDLGRGALGRSIDLAKEGKWAEAMSTLVGTNVDWGVVIGGLGRLRRLGEVIETEAETQKVTQAATEGAQAAREAGTLAPESAAPPPWPSWQTSESDFTKQLEEVGFERQGSYLDGKEVRYGTSGSVRPDLSNEGLALSVDVKNYDVASAKGRYRLVQDVIGQVESRSQNLPPGMRQGVVIDIRGQTISDKLLQRLVDRIVDKSNGAISPENIYVVR
jgi:hypothetical protein